MKPVKIKRYKNIYSSNNPFGSPLSIMITMLLVVVLGFIGWFAYPPMYNALISMGDKEDRPPVVSSQPAISQSPASQPNQNAGTVSTPVAPEENPPQNPEPTPIIPVFSGVKAVYAPHHVLGDTGKLDEFLRSIKGSGVNTVVVEGKNNEGYLMYRTQIENANTRQVTDAFDPKTVAGKIKEAGFAPMVLVESFRDPLYARTERSAAVTYMDSDFSWLDNSPDLGGKPWLNPYAKSAREYIIGIGNELASCGFEHIVLSSVQFPGGVGQDKASYGGAGQRPNLTPLNEFIQMAEESFSAKGAKTSVMIPGSLAIKENPLLYGGDPLKLSASSLMIEMLGHNFPSDIEIGGEVVTSPSADYSHLVDILSSYVALQCEGKSLFGILSGVNVDQTPLSQASLEAQIKALNDEFGGYMVMERNGKYAVGAIK